MVLVIDKARQLTNLALGTAGFVSHFTNSYLAGRLVAMGILPGSRLELIRKAPFGGGWYVKADNQLIALRKQEAACIVLR